MARKKNDFVHMNNKDADQPLLLYRLINAFISQSSESMKTSIVICKISKF